MENKITSISKREANRANAKKSTGPRTAEGKQSSRLNALRHGLTGRTIVLPTEDEETYKAFLASHHSMFLPETDQERDLVETLANTKWRLKRCGILEANLFVLGFQQDAPTDAIEAGLSAALTFQQSPDSFLKLSVYEQRLMRLYQITKKELETLQTTRRATAKAEYFDATEIRNLLIDKDRPFEPAYFGFVSTKRVLEQLMRRREAVGGNVDFDPGPESAA